MIIDGGERSISLLIDQWLLMPAGERLQALEHYLQRHPEAVLPLAQELGLGILDELQLAEAELIFTRVSLNEAISMKVLPVMWQQQEWLIIADPFSLDTRQWAQQLPCKLALAAPGYLQAKLEWLHKQQRTLDQLEHHEHEQDSEETLLEITPDIIAKERNPVIKLLNATLYDAIQSRASDIHLSAVPEGLAVKYRVDGVMHYIRHCQGVQYAEQVISRLKVLSSMDISERRVPQDGRFKALIHQRLVDFRVSIVPGSHGEDSVLRVLDKSGTSKLDLVTLGFDTHGLAAIRKLTHQPHGMVLVTGPTGSGKSTTLYAALSELNNGEGKIITIEDPVEYQLSDILQIPVNDKKGLSFARGLRAILRHDPDIILVGEIRDSETAGIAVQAALTGHLVLSSVHANDVFSVLERFMYMDVEPQSLLTALNGVIAQRLVRGICPECASSSEPTPQEIRQWQQSDLRDVVAVWRKGTGCEACRQTGYRGRLALAEVLNFSDAMKEALQNRTPIRQLREIARAEGFVPLYNVAVRAVLEGKTTLQEINRVIADY